MTYINNTYELATRAMEKELDADRSFFKRHPKRKHYVRPIFPNEKKVVLLERPEIANDKMVQNEVLFEIYVIVRKISRNLRQRAFITGPAPDLGILIISPTLGYGVFPKDLHKIKEREARAFYKDFAPVVSGLDAPSIPSVDDGISK